MFAILKFMIIAAFLWLPSACSTIEETVKNPQLSLVDKEIKAAKTVGPVVMLPPMGADSNTESSIAKAATNAHGSSLRQMKHTDKVFKYVGSPKNFAKFVVANFQAQFVQKIAGVASKGGAVPEKIELANVHEAGKLVKNISSTKELKVMMTRLKPSSDEIAKMNNALYNKGDADTFIKPTKMQQKIMAMSDKVNRYVFKKLKAKYALVTVVDGAKNSWQKQKSIRLSAGLVNINTGQLRYFASIETTEGAEDYTYDQLITLMSNKLFKSVSDNGVLVN